MSRYSFENELARFVGGYDRPLSTFFAANGGNGAFFSGPVVCTGEQRGLTPEQVRGCVRAELFFVDPQVRDAVTHLWYRGVLGR